MEDFQSLGIGGIVALLIIREAFAHWRRKTCNGLDPEVRRWLKDLWDWHSLTDNEGVKVWYVRRSLEDAITKLADNINVQTDLLRELCREAKATREKVEALHVEA